MQAKQKREFILALLLIAGLILLLIWLFSGRTVQETVEEVIETQEEVVETVVPSIGSAQDAPAQPETVARVFVERFGSFSTESGYENIETILNLATSDLQERLQTIAAEARTENGQEYYGVSTRLISLTTVSTSETEKMISITTQREEAFGSPGNTSVRYQDITVTLVQDGANWLVADFVWSS
jgi:hypothetical protein